jgi:Protein of unknown function (DUF2865)
MPARGKKAFKSTILQVSFGVFAAGVLTFGALAPASAQGIFERIFGGLRHTVEAPAGLPANIQAYADPFADMKGPSAPSQRTAAGPATGYCVRTSDGFYFPVQAHAGVSAADACRTFCPASQTRLYSGSGIDHAFASDGSRYTDLDTAFLYRKQLVVGSTCNGRDPFGLARVDVDSDPTLRPGDVVATKSGLVAFTGMKNKVADFTPLDGNRGVPKSTRDKLSDVRIMPPNPGAPNVTPVTLSGRTRADDNRSAQLAR